jgi:FkbM family methyltransferase
LDVPGAGQVHFWSLGDDYITSRLWWLGIAGYEPETVAPYLRFVADAAVVIDIGAYTGYYSLLAAAKNRSARVFAFEPHPGVAARLGHNLDLNPSLTVTVIPSAVGAQRGVASFYLGGPGLPLSSSLAPAWKTLDRAIPVTVTDLDSFVAEWGLEKVDVIKVDVESVEDAVIRGMTGVLSRFRPTIFLEVLPGEYRGETSKLLRELGYLFYYLTFAGPVPEDELASTEELIDHAHTPFNHVACPSERLPFWLRRADTR